MSNSAAVAVGSSPCICDQSSTGKLPRAGLNQVERAAFDRLADLLHPEQRRRCAGTTASSRFTTSACVRSGGSGGDTCSASQMRASSCGLRPRHRRAVPTSTGSSRTSEETREHEPSVSRLLMRSHYPLPARTSIDLVLVRHSVPQPHHRRRRRAITTNSVVELVLRDRDRLGDAERLDHLRHACSSARRPARCRAPP